MDDPEKLKIALVLEAMLNHKKYHGQYMCIDLGAAMRTKFISEWDYLRTKLFIERRIGMHNMLIQHLAETKEFGLKYVLHNPPEDGYERKVFWYRQVINELRGLPVTRWESRWTAFSRWLKVRLAGVK